MEHKREIASFQDFLFDSAAMDMSMFSGESELERVLGQKYDLNVTEEDLMRFGETRS